MVASVSEAMQLVAILLRYMDKERAHKMLRDMEFEIADLTENDSLKRSIIMVREFLE
tara:strand:- start:141 stop:311 length:171 start_codon:yes stop_codon:yes gene_type:complete